MKKIITASVVTIVGILLLCTSLISMSISNELEIILTITLLIGFAGFVTGFICLLAECFSKDK